MKRIPTVLLLALSAATACAQADVNVLCADAYETAQQEKSPAGGASAMRVVNAGGRLYFHSAPDERCRLKSVFVVPNDRLEVFADHGAYTEVIYWHPVTGAGTAGWVPSARLAEMRQMLGYTGARQDDSRP